ncbi:MAG: ABC transporter substrate-binding protein, partial [Dehalococcoidales bacterium]
SPELVYIQKPDIVGIGIAVILLPTVVSQEEFLNITIKDSENTVQDYKLLSQKEIRENGATAGYEIDYEYTVNGVEWRGRSLLMKRGRYGFALSGDARESVYELNKPLLDACLESFMPPVVAVGSYTNPAEGFSITLPAGWDGLETGERTPLLEINNPAEESPIYINIYMERIFESTTAEEFAKNIASLFSDLTDYKIESQGEVTLGRATQGYEVIFTSDQNGLTIRRKIVSVIRGTQAFTTLVFTLASTYDERQSTIDELVGSFTLEEPKPFGASRQTSLFLSEGEIVTLDPALAETGAGGIVGAIFSGLVMLDRNLKAAPDIAKSWEVNDDGTVYTFHLREGVKFHDGKPVTARDFKYSWERALAPETDSRKARLFLGDIVGASEMLDGEATELSGVRVIDDLTLKVTVDGPKPYFLDKLAYVTAHVVDRANVARGMNWTDNPNGTGPFKLKEWKKDELLILERNDEYYLEPAKFEHVVFQIFAGRPMMMYERGEIDVTDVNLPDLERVTDPTSTLNQELMTTPSIGIGYLGFNVTKPPFDDPKVRRAFALALDMDKIIEVSFKNNADRATGFMPPGIPGHNQELEPLPFDPEKAMQLIGESKYGSIDNLPPVVLYALYGLGPHEEAAIGMWQMNLGVAVEAQIIEELEEWYERGHHHEFQLFFGGWIADYVDPQNFLEVLFHGKSEENRFAYVNAEVDTALEEAAVERNEEARRRMYQEIEKIILEDLPAVPFYQSWKEHVLVKPYMEGYYLAPIGINIWKDISIKPH